MNQIANLVPTVWGVFVGEGGESLGEFNSQQGPFPPKPNTEGFVAVGWARVGDMTMYKGVNGYAQFLENFAKVFPDCKKTQANSLWNFAFEIKKGDRVISPSSTLGFLLVGEFTGEYVFDTDENSIGKSRTQTYLMHLQKVKWQTAIPQNDARYSALHRIGQHTVSQLSMTSMRLDDILRGQLTQVKN